VYVGYRFADAQMFQEEAAEATPRASELKAPTEGAS
jgi:hypothetical protein